MSNNKRRILIIEDDYYKCFTWKQILESEFNLPVDYIKSGYGESIEQVSRSYKPHSILYNKYLSAFDFIESLRKRKVNALNSTVLLVARVEDDAPIPYKAISNF